MPTRTVVATLVALALFTAGSLAALADTTPPVATTTDVTTTDAAAATAPATTTADVSTATTAAPAPTTTTTETTTTSYDPWAAWLAAIAAYRAAHGRTSAPTHTPPPGGGGGPVTTTVPAPPPPPPAHLVVSGSETPASGATVGSTVALSYTVTNTGGRSVPATFADVLPAQVALIEADSDVGSCSGDRTVSCDLGTIAGGQAVTVTVAVQVVQAAPFADAPSVAAGDPSVGVEAPRAQQATAGVSAPVRFGRVVSRAR